MKKFLLYGFLIFLYSVPGSLLLNACAGKKSPEPLAEEKLLVAAGFRFKVAEDDEMLEKMAKLPQRQLFRYDQLEEPVWVFPYVAGCNCLYAGDDEAYKRLQELLNRERRSARLQGSGIDLGTRNKAAIDKLDISMGMLP